ncbi:MAG: helix-turn-helix domain-containing protein [Methylomonas sp.]
MNKILITYSIICKLIIFKMNKLSANAVLDRLQQAAGVKSDSALSRALAINRATLGNWRNRDSVPYSICVNFAIEHGISLNWLLAGQCHMAVDETGQSLDAQGSDRAKLIELFEGLGADQRQEALQLISEKKRLNDLEKAVQDLQQKIVSST